MSESIQQYIPIAMQFLVASGFVITTIVASWLLGPKVKTLHKLDTFESGLQPVGNARMQFSIKYFLVATIFVLFDVEVIFFYPWAVNFREFIQEGFEGFGKMLLFMAPVLIGFFYVIKKGALEWD
ncbi:MAG: NADH-quinone oxidoreductase subunit A [Cytophagaceae bacterium]|nr:NADH-quinone oxidoreductase subunit A [Cytophagaceae bacterium]MDW8455983.1 NADH-quinone oxidoreductase subunit A [Cytophagaceae bacterium]